MKTFEQFVNESAEPLAIIVRKEPREKRPNAKLEKDEPDMYVSRLFDFPGKWFIKSIVNDMSLAQTMPMEHAIEVCNFLNKNEDRTIFKYVPFDITPIRGSILGKNFGI